jgi:hypothetical protein
MNKEFFHLFMSLTSFISVHTFQCTVCLPLGLNLYLSILNVVAVINWIVFLTSFLGSSLWYTEELY